jgi:DNA-directed RNA polymerase subunit RPC12/RpoP
MELSSVIEGKCPKCGKQYFGWSLQNPRNQSCANCGSGLIILEDGRLPVWGYSPFTAPEYKLKSTYLDYHKQEKGKLAQ